MNTRGSRAKTNKFEAVANYYLRHGGSGKSNGEKMVENEKRTTSEVAAKTVTETVTEEGEYRKRTMETVVVGGEEEDTVSPLSSKQSIEENRGKRNEEWKTAGKEKRDVVTEAANRVNTVGIKLVRIGSTGTTGYIPGDVSHFFKILRRVDPTAIILNARKEKSSATTTEDMEKMNAMDYKGFLDMRNDSWGSPTENKSKTVWMCYIATDTMTPNLQQLRDDGEAQDYLRRGNIILQYTKLLESNSRVAFPIANKDPKYTNRQDVEERLRNHMRQYSEKDIPIHVLNMATSGKNFNTRMCTAVVGGKDVRKVESIFKDHPYSELELIPFSWKFQDGVGYTRRLKEHEGVLKISRAIKLEEMNVNDEFEDFKMLMRGDPAKEYVIDVFPATHATRTGVVYVQYINDHKNAVMGMIQHIVGTIKKKRQEQGGNVILPFPNGPTVVTTIGSTTQSVQTNTSNNTGSIIPSSKYGDLLKSNAMVPTATKIPWAISVNNKSFLEAVTGQGKGHQDPESDTDTLKSGNSGNKSIREIELETRNILLTRQLQEREDYYQNLIQRIQEDNEMRRKDDERKRKADKEEHAQEIAELRAMILRIDMRNKQEEKSEESNKNQGSTPKRKKRDTNIPVNDTNQQNPLTGATLEEEFPEESLIMEDSMTDAEPIHPEEGLNKKS